MVKLTNFETNALRLIMVSLRLMSVYHEFPKNMQKGDDAILARSNLRDFCVEQLHNWIKIRKDMRKDPKFKKLDDLITPLIQPILDKKKPLKKLRDNYVSHIQEEGRNFKDLPNDIVQKYKLPTNWAFYSHLAGLAFYYYGIVDNNFKKEFDHAMKVYEAKMGVPIKITSGYTMINVDKKIMPVLNPLHVKLVDNGYVTTISKENIAKVRKKYGL